MNHTNQCVDGVWHANGETLANGIHYAGCAVHLNGSRVGGTATVVAEGALQVSGTRAAFDPFVDGLLFLSGSTADSAIKVSASSSSFRGYLFAETDEIELSGSGNRFACGILGDRVDISANGMTVRARDCTRPRRTAVPPTVDPHLGLELKVDHTDATPGDALAHGATVSNDGTTLFVPGVIGLENLGTASATVTGATYGLEYLSVQDGRWHPLGDRVTLTARGNAARGVAYPTSGDGIVGTTLEPDALALWGAELRVELTPERVKFLLDPARVAGLRNAVDFDLSPTGAPVRSLFRFGNDLLDRVRALGADITNAEVVIAPPVGLPSRFDAAGRAGLDRLSPGESVQVALTSAVPVPSPKGATESHDAYLARLDSLDGTPLTAFSSARGSGGPRAGCHPGGTCLSLLGSWAVGARLLGGATDVAAVRRQGSTVLRVEAGRFGEDGVHDASVPRRSSWVAAALPDSVVGFDGDAVGGFSTRGRSLRGRTMPGALGSTRSMPGMGASR